ncbi:MAG: hypothetical protein IT249_20730 [Chitinophagaceae bacterium]|nr:hypothetical protein [Chitinophagaceae bacterium]
MQRLFLLLLVIFLNACKNNQQDKDALFHILASNIDETANNISERNATLYYAFNYQLEDPILKDKTAILFPIITKIHAYSDSIVQQIRAIKRVIHEEELKGNTIEKPKLRLQNLYDSLIHFKSSIFRIDPEINQAFKDSIPLSNISLDTTQQSFKSFEQTFFSVQSNEAYIALLSVLENKIRVLENKLVVFYYDKTTYHGCNAERDVPLLSQDKSIVAGEDSIEITAAIGEVVSTGNPEMKIMGQKIEVNNLGLMIYKFKANKTKGKHAVPVTISFIDENTGIREDVSKTLYYTVR